MTNTATIIWGLLYAFPIVYGVGAYAILSKIAQRNGIKIIDVVHNLCKKISLINFVKYFLIATFVVICANYIFSTSDNESSVHALIVFDAALLIVTTVWAILGNSAVETNKIWTLNSFSDLDKQFYNSNSHSDINANHDFYNTDSNDDLTNGNSEFDSDYEFSDNADADRDIDPAYSSMQSNIYHDG